MRACLSAGNTPSSMFFRRCITDTSPSPAPAQRLHSFDNQVVDAFTRHFRLQRQFLMQLDRNTQRKFSRTRMLGRFAYRSTGLKIIFNSIRKVFAKLGHTAALKTHNVANTKHPAKKTIVRRTEFHRPGIPAIGENVLVHGITPMVVRYSRTIFT